MFVLLGFLTAAAVAMYVALPLLKPAEPDSSQWTEETADGFDDLIARRNTLYREIADLDFDYQTGKVADADYAVQRTEYVDEAAALLEQLDQRSAASAERQSATREVAAEIEAEVRRLRGFGVPRL